MIKSNKELAVELYCALIQARAVIVSNANAPVKIPANKEVVDEISELAELLSNVKEK